MHACIGRWWDRLQLQIIQVRGQFNLFRAWGRTGTSIGGSKVERLSSKDGAIVCALVVWCFCLLSCLFVCLFVCLFACLLAAEQGWAPGFGDRPVHCFVNLLHTCDTWFCVETRAVFVRLDSQAEFRRLFYEKTGNEWGSPFEKVPGKFCLVDVEFGVDDDDVLQQAHAAEGPFDRLFVFAFVRFVHVSVHTCIFVER
jgi:hypothetical protein